ncbi:hypothetical protein MalM25_17800 [Planctomycetes bacterium MalM25]|nr:hypothetical protein MalM25_17800 [Planctomycetes bacterium MalM25]
MTNQAMSTPYPSTIGIDASFGFGDRIGLATPGHVAAMRQAGGGITPIYAQQSIREMTRTGRTASEVMGDAMSALLGSQWTQPHGADADHLKTEADIESTAEVGFTFFTLDPSDHVDQKADDYDQATVAEKFEALVDGKPLAEVYTGRKVTLARGTELVFDELAVKRAAVKYGAAIEAAVRLGLHAAKFQEAAERPYEIELSVDETDQPTTLVEHYIIAEQCLSRGVKLVSLAPRFIGELEKGVDYIGDVAALEASLADHAAIAESLGPYKLSLHSGSDKISMYPALARATKGRFHVKTAGTSYLEAVRVAALEEPDLFRDAIRFARERYDTDRATYHVHATLASAPEPDASVSDEELQDAYLERWETVPEGLGFTKAGRQILHCTFGSSLTDPKLGAALRACLEKNLGTYTAVLAEHFSRHLNALR